MCNFGIHNYTDSHKDSIVTKMLLLCAIVSYGNETVMPSLTLTFKVNTTSGPISCTQGLSKGRLESRHWCTVLLVLVFNRSNVLPHWRYKRRKQGRGGCRLEPLELQCAPRNLALTCTKLNIYKWNDEQTILNEWTAKNCFDNPYDQPVTPERIESQIISL